MGHLLQCNKNLRTILLLTNGWTTKNILYRNGDFGQYELPSSGEIIKICNSVTLRLMYVFDLQSLSRRRASYVVSMVQVWSKSITASLRNYRNKTLGQSDWSTDKPVCLYCSTVGTSLFYIAEMNTDLCHTNNHAMVYWLFHKSYYGA